MHNYPSNVICIIYPFNCHNLIHELVLCILRASLTKHYVFKLVFITTQHPKKFKLIYKIRPVKVLERLPAHHV